jgi:hypothetical protein
VLFSVCRAVRTSCTCPASASQAREPDSPHGLKSVAGYFTLPHRHARNFPPSVSTLNDIFGKRAHTVGAITLPPGKIISPVKVPVVRVITVIQSPLSNWIGYGSL